MRLKVSNVCQLLDKSKYPATHTKLGCTFTNNGDGSFTINGTIQNGGSWSNSLQQITQNLYGHKILLLTNSTSDIVRGEMKFTLQNGSSKWGTYNSIYTVKYDNYKYISIRIYMDNVDAGKTIDNATVKFQLFDLTEMYGAGHEPATVAEFRQRFPNELYPYSPQCWLTSYKSAVVCKTKNLFDYKTSDEKTKTNNGITLILNTDYFELSGQQQAGKYIELGQSGFNIPFEIGKTYVLSADTIVKSGGKVFMRARYTDGESPLTEWETVSWNLFNGTIAKRFTPTRPGYFDKITFYNAGDTIPISGDYIIRIQLEQGSTASPYQPYGYLPLNRGKYIANKEPVQLLDKSKYRGSSTVEGITFTNNGDGTWTVVGTAPDVPANKEYVSKVIIGWTLEFSKKHFIPGHKIVVAGGVSRDSAGKVADVQWVWGWTGGYDAANSWERTIHTIKQYPEDKLLEWSNYIELRVYAGATVNFTFKPQFFDLTEMYGAGNEPTTVEQFRADFPNELYDYNPYNAITFR